MKGKIITATALLASNPRPTGEEKIAAMEYNFYRCGSYLNIIEAMESVIDAS